MVSVTAGDWMKGIGLSVTASIIGGASKLAIRKSWVMLEDSNNNNSNTRSSSGANNNHRLKTIVRSGGSNGDHHSSKTSPRRSSKSNNHASSTSNTMTRVSYSLVDNSSSSASSSRRNSLNSIGAGTGTGTPPPDDNNNNGVSDTDLLSSVSDTAAAPPSEEYIFPRHQHVRSSSTGTGTRRRTSPTVLRSLAKPFIPVKNKELARCDEDSTSPFYHSQYDYHNETIMMDDQARANPLSCVGGSLDLEQHATTTTSINYPSTPSKLIRNPNSLTSASSSLAESSTTVSSAQQRFRRKRAALEAKSRALRYCGMFGMTVLNPICCVWAMQYASPSILAPFSGLTLVWIIVFSGCVIGERPKQIQILAAGWIVLGEVIVALWGDHTNETGHIVSLQALMKEYRQPAVLFYFVSLGCWMTWVFHVIMESEKFENISCSSASCSSLQVLPVVSTSGSSNSMIFTSGRGVGGQERILSSETGKPACKCCKFTSATFGASNHTIRRFVWGIAGGSLTGLQNFLKDSLTILKITQSSIQHTDDATAIYKLWTLLLSLPPIFYVFFVCAAGSSFVGLLLLTACMRRYDATFSSAMFVGSFVLSASCMAAARYHTIAHLKGIWSYILYPTGLIILLIGIYILATTLDDTTADHNDPHHHHHNSQARVVVIEQQQQSQWISKQQQQYHHNNKEEEEDGTAKETASITFDIKHNNNNSNHHHECC